MKPEFAFPSLSEIKKSTIRGSSQRKAMSYLYGEENKYRLQRHPIYNNFSFSAQEPVIGSTRVIIDDPAKGVTSVDTLLSQDSFSYMDQIMERIAHMPLDIDLILKVYDRLSTSRALSGLYLCGGVEVITDRQNPGSISHAFIVYPELYERGEVFSVPPAMIGEQMALLYLQHSL